MVTFDEIKPGAHLRGIDPSGLAEIVQVSRFGADALNLVFRASGRVGERLLYRGEEACRNGPKVAPFVDLPKVATRAELRLKLEHHREHPAIAHAISRIDRLRRTQGQTGFAVEQARSLFTRASATARVWA